MQQRAAPVHQAAGNSTNQRSFLSAVRSRQHSVIRASQHGLSADIPVGAGRPVLLQKQKTLRVNYVRRDGNYTGWVLHVWGDVVSAPAWGKGLSPSGYEDGPYWELVLKPSANHVGVLVYKGDSTKGEEKAAGAEHIDPSKVSRVWLAQYDQHAYTEPPDMDHIVAGTLYKAHAHWVRGRDLLWRVPVSEDGELSSPQRRFFLHYSRHSHMHVTAQGIENAEITLPLRIAGLNLPGDLTGKYPHLYGCTHLQLDEQYLKQIPDLVQGQLALSVQSHTGRVLDCTGVQLPGVLDDVFFTDEPLGDHYCLDTQTHRISVWAPTAQKVELLHWWHARGGEPEVHPMTRNSKGVWSLTRPKHWRDTCYKYRVTVFCPWTNKIEVTEATDPYARCTTANGERTLLVDLLHPALQPPGWWEHPVPRVQHWTDISVYELHIRDFSVTDPSVPDHLRGKYRAFCRQHLYPTEKGRLSHGLAHLKGLREAGLNHIHLLPTYDYGSVPERPEEQAHVQDDLSQYPPDSEAQQQIVLSVADRDGFNWGYDPVHYGVPEGSYSTAPDGPMRILEFREMVQALHSLGFRVVLDVVYNHTFASGPYSSNSVLDKIVPGYYHRRQEDGEICHSTCCNNTASEHRMFERLMVDDLVHWARDYKIDGFRFDIMGHHFVDNMASVRNALNQLTVDKDGVDGRAIYIYGEAWDFGEVALNQRGRNASQHNLGGSRMGAFNDRMRDGAMGGSPYQPLDTQGFATGLAVAPNGASHQGSAKEQLATLLHRTDWVRFALAGNLRDYETQVADGRLLAGHNDTYHGNQPLTYGCDPAENVVFVGCHDNETIFDQVVMRVGQQAGPDGVARVCGLCLALVTLSQGIPFIHAGDDLLRSKSLDRDSYNSGDWFNRIDWTGHHNNFGVGMPPASKNYHQWPFKGPLLSAWQQYKPSQEVIATQAAYFKALLRVRYSSPLLRMPTAEHIKQQVRFENTGPDQVPGVIIMQLHSSWQPEHGTWDPKYKQLLLVFNARPEPYEGPFPEGSEWFKLHPALAALQRDTMVQLCSADNEKRRLHVSPRMAAVFVQER